MDTPKLFQIGTMAKLFQISVSSIRHYERLGLLKPEYIDSATGYRYYSTRQFEVFNTIRYLRALDMPLSEISDFLKNRDIDRIEEKLRQQKDAVVKKQQELQRIERKINNRLNQLHDAQNSETDTIKLTLAPKCKLFWVRQPLKITNFHDIEEPTIKLAQNQAEAVIFLGKVGVSISEEKLRAGNFDEYDGIFLVLDDEDNFNGDIMELPETLCVTVRFHGSHTESPQQYSKLKKYITQNNLKISGFSREITMIDYGITNDTDKFVTEISIPVSRF